MRRLSKAERRAFYNSKVWRLKSEEIKRRDNYECQWCKEEGRVTVKQDVVLEVDHIRELETHPDLALVNENLRTLCKDCHNKRHKRFRYSKRSKKASKWNDEWFGD